MIICKASSEILDYPQDMISKLERYGRNCYKSENNITYESASDFIRRISDNGHGAILEHCVITVRIIADRGFLAELTRHRVGVAYSVESTRYCNYSKEKFGKELTFIEPFFFKKGARDAEYYAWLDAMKDAENYYMKLINYGASAQEARSVLPMSTKTDIIITANVRAWQHIFKLRCSKASHPSMREVMIPLREKFNSLFPELFIIPTSPIPE